ncbi:TetR/AcrR family transcriptional regulator [Microbacterium gorillae]|uniref:TetR/AcrR family transcriptional regulator n=1 Tax=Microbacterium gorillae TaxID=1231063 RepID=UPI000591254A|nr:helix-turn-helix domain-containing protein [Microbacterium gorillae]
MTQHTERTRDALLRSAEELFAREGVEAVSNRRIAEHAGAANHSAVAYHFGSRDDLLRALLERDRDRMALRRDELDRELGRGASMHDVITARILPWIELLAEQPTPSWRARFLEQVSALPEGAALLRENAIAAAGLDDLLDRDAFTDVDLAPSVRRARAGIVGAMVLRACAEYEQRREDGTAEGDWLAMGYFLIDAATGLVTAPATPRADFVRSRL